LGALGLRAVTKAELCRFGGSSCVAEEKTQASEIRSAVGEELRKKIKPFAVSFKRFHTRNFMFILKALCSIRRNCPIFMFSIKIDVLLT
jgi:hypothetical protein